MEMEGKIPIALLNKKSAFGKYIIVLILVILCGCFIANNTFISMIEQMYIKANFKCGAASDIIVTSLVKLFKQFDLVFSFFGFWSVPFLLKSIGRKN